MPAAIEEIAPGYMRVSRTEAERRARYAFIAEKAKELGIEQMLKDRLGVSDVSDLMDTLYELVDDATLSATERPKKSR